MDESSLQGMMAGRLHLPLRPNLCIPKRHVELNMKLQGQKLRGGEGREGTDQTKRTMTCWVLGTYPSSSVLFTFTA